MKFKSLARKTIVAGAIFSIIACTQKSPEELIASAELLMQDGKSEAAIIELKNAVSNAPDYAPARLALGKVYYAAGRLAAGEKELRRALELGTSQDEVLPLLVQTYYHMDQFEAARSLIEQYTGDNTNLVSKLKLYQFLSSLRDASGQPMALSSMENDMQELELQVAKAYRYFSGRNYEMAAATLGEISSDNDYGPELAFIQGLVAFKQGDFATASAQFAQTKEIIAYPNAVNFLLIESLINEKQFERAQIEVNKLFQINKEHPLVNKYKARIEQNAGNDLQALQFAEKAIQNGIDSLEMRVLAGVTAYREKEFERAYRHLKVAESAPGGHQDAVRRLLTSVQLNLGYNLEAVESLQAITNLNKDDARLFALTSTEFALSGEDALAAELLDKAATLDEQNTDVKLSQAMLKAGSDTNAAIALLEEAIVLDESLNIGWMQMAVTHLMSGDKAAALEVAQRWQEKDPVNAKVLTAFVHLQTGAFDQAESLLNEVISENPQHLGAESYLLRLYGTQQRNEEKYALAKRMLGHSPTTTMALINLIDAAEKTGKVADAEGFLATLESEDSSLPKVYSAVLKSKLGQYGQAIDILKPLSDKGLLGFITLGDAYLENGDTTEAVNTYQQMAKAFPRSLLPLLRQAGIAADRGDFNGALKVVNEALKRSPGSRQVKGLKLHYLTKLNQFDEAERVLEDLQREKGGEYDAMLPLYAGQIALNTNKFAKAEKLLQQYHSRYPTYPSALMLAKAHLGLGNVDKAVAVIEEQLQLSPDTPVQFVSNSADFFSHIGQYARAAELYQSLLVDNPQHPLILNNFAYNQAMSGENLDAAREAAKKANAIAKDNPYFLDTLGTIERKTKNYDAAYAAMSEANRLLGDNNEINLHFAELLLEMGLAEKAKEILRQVKNPSPKESEALARIKQTYGM